MRLTMGRVYARSPSHPSLRPRGVCQTALLLCGVARVSPPETPNLRIVADKPPQLSQGFSNARGTQVSVQVLEHEPTHDKCRTLRSTSGRFRRTAGAGP